MTDGPEATADSFDDLDIGETAELTDTFDLSVWNQIDNEFVGREREIDDMRIADAQIAGSEGNERIVVEVAADVTHVDPATKPVFQTEEAWERNSHTDTSPTPAWAKTMLSGLPYAISAAVVGFVLFTTNRALEQADMTINGEQLATPGFFPMLLAVAAILFVVWAIQYLPGMAGRRCRR